MRFLTFRMYAAEPPIERRSKRTVDGRGINGKCDFTQNLKQRVCPHNRMSDQVPVSPGRIGDPSSENSQNASKACGPEAFLFQGGVPVNQLTIIRAPSKHIKEPHLVILVDGRPLDLLIAEIVDDDWYAGLVTTLDDCLFRMEDRQFVWERILPVERAIVPILVCPDDLDFFCTVVNVDVVADQESIRWERVGVGDPTDPASIEWWPEIPPFQFSRQDYESFLAECRSLKTEWWSGEGGAP